MRQFRIGQKVKVKKVNQEIWSEVWDHSGEYRYVIGDVRPNGYYLLNEFSEVVNALDQNRRWIQSQKGGWIESWFDNDDDDFYGS